MSVRFTAFADSCALIKNLCEEVDELEEERFDSACVTVARAGLFFGNFGFIRSVRFCWFVGFCDDDFFITGVTFAITVFVCMTCFG